MKSVQNTCHARLIPAVCSKTDSNYEFRADRKFFELFLKKNEKKTTASRKVESIVCRPVRQDCVKGRSTHLGSSFHKRMKFGPANMLPRSGCSAKQDKEPWSDRKPISQ